MPVKHAAPKLAERRRTLAAPIALLLLGSPLASYAADCAVTAVNLNFGAYDPVATGPDDAVGTVTVTCRYVSTATRIDYSVTLSSGANSSSFTSRQLANGATARLGYNVFVDPARTQVWGTGSSGTVIARGSMTVGPGQGNSTRTATHTVYGRIPALQDAVPGSYSDRLVLTLTF